MFIKIPQTAKQRLQLYTEHCCDSAKEELTQFAEDLTKPDFWIFNAKSKWEVRANFALFLARMSDWVNWEKAMEIHVQKQLKRRLDKVAENKDVAPDTHLIDRFIADEKAGRTGGTPSVKKFVLISDETKYREMVKERKLEELSLWYNYRNLEYMKVAKEEETVMDVARKRNLYNQFMKAFDLQMCRRDVDPIWVFATWYNVRTTKTYYIYIPAKL